MTSDSHWTDFCSVCSGQSLKDSPRDPAEDTAGHQHLDRLSEDEDEDCAYHTRHCDEVGLLVPESIRCPSVDLESGLIECQR